MSNTPPFHIVLIEPEIPPNTGSIARLCAATGANLHLVGKLGFSIEDKHLKRAGLDYWHAVNVQRWDNLDALRREFPDGRFWYTSKKADRMYTEVSYQEGDFLVFGKESYGLPDDLLAQNQSCTIRIPIMHPAVRSLNLATASGIVLYEALRQTGNLS